MDVSTMEAFLDSPRPLSPADAAAALIVTEAGEYLLQRRDDKPEIFYPGHWGLFGGALDPDETPVAALCRELAEELGVTVVAGELSYFTNFDMDFSFAGCGIIKRGYYLLHLDRARQDAIRLGEGREVAAFPARHILSRLPLVPYDGFAVWMHSQQARIRRAGP